MIHKLRTRGETREKPVKANSLSHTQKFKLKLRYVQKKKRNAIEENGGLNLDKILAVTKVK